MWDDFVNNECNYISENLIKRPVVIAKHLKVTSFDGLSLSTKANTTFFIDASFEIVSDFKAWIETNIDAIDHFVSEKAYLKLTLPKVSLPKEDRFTELKDIQQLQHAQRFFWVKTKSCIKKFSQSSWYMSCNNCPNATATPRAMVYFELKDSTGYINATAIGEPAEKFLLCSAQNLMEQTLSDVKTYIIDFIRTSIEDVKVFYIKAVQKEPNSAHYKYDDMFMLDSILSITDNKDDVKDKAKGYLFPSLSSFLSNEEASPTPTVKRSLFQPLEPVTSTKKKIEKDNTGTKLQN